MARARRQGASRTERRGPPTRWRPPRSPRPRPRRTLPRQQSRACAEAPPLEARTVPPPHRARRRLRRLRWRRHSHHYRRRRRRGRRRRSQPTRLASEAQSRQRLPWARCGVSRRRRPVRRRAKLAAASPLTLYQTRPSLCRSWARPRPYLSRPRAAPLSRPKDSLAPRSLNPPNPSRSALRASARRWWRRRVRRRRRWR